MCPDNDKPTESDPNMTTRSEMERLIVSNLVETAIKYGFDVSRVYDGEESHRATTVDQVLEVVFSVDDCTVYFKHPDQDKAHCAVIVLGNDGWDAIADASVGPIWDDVMAECNQFADKLCEDAT